MAKIAGEAEIKVNYVQVPDTDWISNWHTVYPGESNWTIFYPTTDNIFIPLMINQPLSNQQKYVFLVDTENCDVIVKQSNGYISIINERNNCHLYNIYSDKQNVSASMKQAYENWYILTIITENTMAEKNILINGKPKSWI